MRKHIGQTFCIVVIVILYFKWAQASGDVETLCKEITQETTTSFRICAPYGIRPKKVFGSD
jgi:hypothetical protein